MIFINVYPVTFTANLLKLTYLFKRPSVIIRLHLQSFDQLWSPTLVDPFMPSRIHSNTHMNPYLSLACVSQCLKSEGTDWSERDGPALPSLYRNVCMHLETYKGSPFPALWFPAHTLIPLCNALRPIPSLFLHAHSSNAFPTFPIDSSLLVLPKIKIKIKLQRDASPSLPSLHPFSQ
jgi:hypothetical protein